MFTDYLVWTIQNIVFPVLVPIVLLTGVILAVWLERRGSAFIQDRVGPNRVDIFGFRNAGLLQPVVDAIKLVVKEDFMPAKADKFLFLLAPMLCLIPALITFAVIPFGDVLEWDKYRIPLQVADLNVGLLYIFAVASLGVYGIVLAGWASNNKYALIGGMRAAAQMISYEMSIGLSIIALLLIFQSVRLNEIVQMQSGTWLWIIPKWGIFYAPVGFVIFFVASLAETNRIPFDMPEAEAEIVAGYHLEYSSFKFSMFFMGEYINIMVASGFIVSLFLGGWQIPWVPADKLLAFCRDIGLGAMAPFVTAGIQIVIFVIKLWLVLWIFVWIRMTLPRLRYDQLMSLGWKVLLPLALINMIVYAFGRYIYVAFFI